MAFLFVEFLKTDVLSAQKINKISQPIGLGQLSEAVFRTYPRKSFLRG